MHQELQIRNEKQTPASYRAIMSKRDFVFKTESEDEGNRDSKGFRMSGLVVWDRLLLELISAVCLARTLPAYRCWAHFITLSAAHFPSFIHSADSPLARQERFVCPYSLLPVPFTSSARCRYLRNKEHTPASSWGRRLHLFDLCLLHSCWKCKTLPRGKKHTSPKMDI